MRAIAALPLSLVVAASSGCGSTRVAAPHGETTRVSQFLVNAVAFDHGCRKDRIAVLRKVGAQADLDVCGAVRRYKMVFSGESSETWVDVTELYPPAALPRPLAEGTAPPGARPEEEPDR
ncbi:hypothetical protein [Anaeromyxobacter sp. Fw109-5]|uniref:hypothetical protein n=1 Tax=Anaeromyxobacter sp. (strain Fw109-5) TaxID=404589 RepID=UPI0000ED739F|nr:hypothetical protein [Anaeromyxobacter sp. Fw109-5]ABS26842.1 hypothetical protein Anae109_2641 [Anaeromyxobacter sp. Fw109-5]